MLEPISLEARGGRISAELAFLATCGAESQVRPPELRALGYLHKTKAPAWRDRIPETESREYEEQLPKLAKAFADAVPDRQYSALLAAPSSRPDLVSPYAQAIRQRFPQVRDLTPFVRREGSLRSGEGAPFEALLDAMRCDAPPSSSVEGSLLLIDDVFSTGRTAAVLAHLLRDHFGGRAILVACPLRTVDEEASFPRLTVEALQAMMTAEASPAESGGAGEPSK